MGCCFFLFFFFSSRRRHTRSLRDWSSDVCSSDLDGHLGIGEDGTRDDRVIDLLQRLPGEGIVGGELAVMSTHGGGHLALGLAPDDVTGRPNGGHVGTQMRINAHGSSPIERDAY